MSGIIRHWLTAPRTGPVHQDKSTYMYGTYPQHLTSRMDGLRRDAGGSVHRTTPALATGPAQMGCESVGA